MNWQREQYHVNPVFVGLLGVFLLIEFMGMSRGVNAALTAREVVGAVDTTEETALVWKPLALEQQVDAGKLVRTDFGAKTDLLGNDGSFLYIAEATQMVVREFEFDSAKQIRIAHFVVLEGMVVAEAAHFSNYATNIFDVETPTVVASFKFSKAGFKVDKQGNTDVTLLSGRFELTRIGPSSRSVRAKHQSEDGVETELSLSEGGAVSVEITAEGLKTVNIGDSPLKMNVGGESVELSPGASITTSMQNGQPVIKNTSSSSESQVKVGGVLVSSSGTLTLTQTGVQAVGGSTRLPAATIIFQTINQGSTSSTVPATGGGGTGGSSPPGKRPPQRRTVRIPVEVRSQ